MTWIYKGKEFDPELAKDYWGFVYQIHNTLEDKFYIGKKFFTKSKIRQVKKRKKKTRVDSDWINYYGSSATLLADVERLGKEYFKRTILHLCKTKAECSYWESAEIFESNALRYKHFYNDWISCKIRKKHLKSLQITS